MRNDVLVSYMCMCPTMDHMHGWSGDFIYDNIPFELFPLRTPLIIPTMDAKLFKTVGRGDINKFKQALVQKGGFSVI